MFQGMAERSKAERENSRKKEWRRGGREGGSNVETREVREEVEGVYKKLGIEEGRNRVRKREREYSRDKRRKRGGRGRWSTQETWDGRGEEDREGVHQI